MCLKAESVLRAIALICMLLLSEVCISQADHRSLVFSNQTLADILISLAVVHNTDIVVNHNELYQERVSIQLSGQNIETDLTQLLEGRNLQFKIKENQVILQPMIRLYGHIYDQNSNEALINATIYNTASGDGAYTNEYGYFSLLVPYQSQSEISYIGYNPITISAEKRIGIQDVYLSSSLELNEVIVVRSLETELAERSTMETSILDQNLTTVFATGGVADVFQYLFKQSGVNTGADGLGGLHVRGGSTDQNLILYDGVEIYKPSHSLGLFSVFNTDAVNSSQFYKSGMPVKYGGKVSSVLDIRMKEGDLQDWSTTLSTSTLATGISINGPIIKDKTGMSIIARRTHIDPFFKKITTENKLENGSEGFSNHYFYDINAKLHHRLNATDRLYFTYFRSADAYNDETLQLEDEEDYFVDDRFQFNLDWGNEMASLRWNHLVGSSAFSNLTLYTTQFDYSNYTLSDYYTEDFVTSDIQQSKYAYGLRSNITDTGLRYDWDLYQSEGNRLKAGLGYSHRSYDPSVVSYEDEEIISSVESFDDVTEDRGQYKDNSYFTNDIFLYIDQSLQLSQQLSIGLGGRYSYFSGRNLIDSIDFNHHLLQGGAQLHYLLSPSVQLSLAYDHTRQPLHLITSTDIGFPNDLWVPSTEFIDPIIGNQIDLTAHWQIGQQWKLSTSAYYKRLTNIIRYQDNISLPSISDNISTFWETDVLVGEGQSYGLNTDLSYRSNKLRTDISYTLSKTTRRFEGLENGKSFPYLFDQPHKLNINSYYKVKDGLWCYANFTWNSGNTQTLYFTDQPFSPLDIYTDPTSFRSEGINTERLPSYHRLDLGIRMSWGAGNLHHDLTVGIQNIYNEKNPYYTYVIEDSIFDGENGRQSRNGLPILPTLSYRIRIGG